jgi:hypothetical protein
MIKKNRKISKFKIIALIILLILIIIGIVLTLQGSFYCSSHNIPVCSWGPSG